MVFDGINGPHDRIFSAGIVPGKHAHGNFLVKGFADLFIFHSFFLQVTPAVALFGGSFYHVFITLPHGSFFDILLAVQEFLHVVDMFGYRFLGIQLHAWIDGGIDLQSIAVQVIVIAVILFMLLAPFLHFFSQYHPEVGAETIVLVQFGVMQVNGFAFQDLCFSAGKIALGNQAVQYQVPPFQCPAGIGAGVIDARAVDHADQYRGFFHTYPVGFFLKKGIGGISDPIHIIAESHRVQV